MTTPSAITGEEWRDTGERVDTYQPDAERDLLEKARRRIEAIRKTDVEVRLVDGAGRPLAGLAVDFEQVSHAFCFGDQVWELDAMIRDGRSDSDRAHAWRQRFVEPFNAATSLCYWTERPGNDASKTEDRQGRPRVENFAETVDWTRAEGLVAKGHPLFWSIPKCIPAWAKRYDTETFMKFAEVRVRSLVARFRGKVTVWDAVNEALWVAAPKHLARRRWPHIETIDDIVEYIAPVLRWAREEDPYATYLINDYGLTRSTNTLPGSDGSEVTAASQRARMLHLLDALGSAGTAPDAVGLQMHTGWLPLAEQWAVYDELQTAGLPLHVTEFWAHTDTLERAGLPPDEIEEIRTRYVEDTLTCAFGHPAMEAFFFWGFMQMALRWRDGYSSHETTGLYDRVRSLIHEQWHTRETLTADEGGTVRFRGFLGNYALRYSSGEGPRAGVRFAVDARHLGPITLRLLHAP